MPSRWFLPVSGLDGARVRRTFAHAAFSRWFDHSAVEHAANDKPYTISGAVTFRGRVGVVITTLNHRVEEDLLAAVSLGQPVRLGNQIRQLGRLELVHTDTWRELADAPPASRWTVEFLSPCTFRSGDRSSPLPTVPTILEGLRRGWEAWSDVPVPPLSPQLPGACWVSDLDLASSHEVVVVHGKRVHLSGVLGSLTLRCDEPEVARTVSPLLRLAPYSGVGAMRGRGFGLVRVRGDRATPASLPVSSDLEPTG